MVRNFFRISHLTLSLFALAAFSGCSSDSDDLGDVCLPDPECVGCVADGDCCQFSLNCGPGRICNQIEAELYDPERDEDICIRVVCDTSADCDAGKVCGRDKLCRAPICQTDSECSGGELCLAGTCQSAPSSEQVASCTVVTRDSALSSGASLTLTAVATNQNGATIGGIDFEWSSSADGVVAVDGNTATGGATQGTAVLTAQPAGTTISCGGEVSIANFPAVAATETRVVVVQDGVGTPVDQAEVIVATATDVVTATTTADGTVTVAVTGTDIRSVTVVKDGWELLTVVEPGVNDIYIPLPKIPDTTVAGGFRGLMDLSQLSAADIQVGFVGPAIPSNVLDFGVEELVGDLLTTEIRAPEVGLDIVEDLPGGLLLALGAQRFTETTEKCLGAEPGPLDLGCYLARAPAGPTATWALGGQLRLGDITGLINELSGLLGGSGDADIPISDILTGVIPLLRRLSHGINASLVTEEFPKIDGQADFARYVRDDIALTQGLSILASVGVPDLPTVGSGNCAAGAVMVTGSNLPGRGLIPLGLSAGLAKATDDCQVAGVSEAFGSGTDDIPDGRMALSMATPHSGIEGTQTFMLLVALDIDQLIADAGVGFQASAIINRVSRVDTEQTLTGEYLPYPTGALDTGAAQLNLTSPVTDLTMTRAEVINGDQTWIVYAPATATVQLPDVPEGRSVLANASSAVVITMKMRSDVRYEDVWRFASGSSLEQLFDTVDAFVVSDCPSGDDSAPCRTE